MKPNIHPAYKELKVVCSCGEAFITRSTLEKDQIHVDVCAKCHPFYTGNQKLVDTAGRVDRFRQKYSMKGKAKADASANKETEKVAAPSKEAEKVSDKGKEKSKEKSKKKSKE
jgi:large subunit ribosomal protein L31